MTDRSPDAAPATVRPAADPFVVQVAWLIADAGGKEALVARSGNRVSVRTLDNWMAGLYPRHKVTGAVRDLDAWAAQHVPGYPEAAGVPRLTESCGPLRPTAAGTPADPPTEPSAEPVATRVRRPLPAWARWVALAASFVLVAAIAVAVTVVVMTRAEAREDAREAAAATAAPALARLRLPSTGDGTEYTKQAGSIGANSYQDPRTLAGHGQKIPPHTTLQVRCRYYAPSVPSVSPDGFWYLIDSSPWNGTWTPANSYMNGDLPGGPTLHNTDLAVLTCR